MSLHLAVPQGTVTLPDDHMELSSDHGMHSGAEADIDIDIDITSDGAVNQDEDYNIEDAKSEMNDAAPWPAEQTQDAIMHEEGSVQGMDEDVDIHVDIIEDVQEDTPVAGYPSEVDNLLPDVDVVGNGADEISPAAALLVSTEGDSSIVSSHTVIAEPVDQEFEISDATVLQHLEGQQGAGATEPAPERQALAEGHSQQSHQERPGSPLPLHPVTLHYGGDEMSLFPPRKDEGSETYFLDNASLAYASMTEVFRAMRVVLAHTIREGDELELAIESLGLYLNEDSISTQSITLAQILDLHVQLHHHDGIENPEPLLIKLTTRTGLSSIMKDLATAVAEGKGLSQLPDWEENEAAEEAEEGLTANDEVADDGDDERYAFEDHEDEDDHEDEGREEANVEEKPSNHGSVPVVSTSPVLTGHEVDGEALDTSTIDQTAIEPSEETLNFDTAAATNEATASTYQEPDAKSADEEREDNESRQATEEEPLGTNEFEDAEEEDIIDYSDNEDEQTGEGDHTVSLAPVDGETTADNEPNPDDVEPEASNEVATPALPQIEQSNDEEARNGGIFAPLGDEEDYDHNPANEETWEASDDGHYDDNVEQPEGEESPQTERATDAAGGEEGDDAGTATENKTEDHPHQNGDHSSGVSDPTVHDANFIDGEEPQLDDKENHDTYIPPPAVEDEDQISYDTDEDEGYVEVEAPNGPDATDLEAGEIDEEADEEADADFLVHTEAGDDTFAAPTATSVSTDIGQNTIAVEAATTVVIEDLSPATERNGSASESQPSSTKRPRAEDDERGPISSPSQQIKRVRST